MAKRAEIPRGPKRRLTGKGGADHAHVLNPSHLHARTHARTYTPPPTRTPGSRPCSIAHFVRAGLLHIDRDIVEELAELKPGAYATSCVQQR